MTIGTLAGAGTITANGGSGDVGGGDGGGAGGRIAIAAGANSFAGTLAAQGANGCTCYGGAGTVYTVVSGQPGLVLVDNGGNAGAQTPLTSTSLPVVASLTVQNGAQVVLTQPSTAGLAVQTDYATLQNLHVASGGLLTTADNALALTMLGNAAIDDGGALILDNLGYQAGQGFGNGGSGSTGCGGGGYGGRGGPDASGYNAGASYGNYQWPTDPGSAGGGGCVSPGGGVLKLTNYGTLQVNGLLSANGGNAWNGNGGGSAGGSLLLVAGALTGDGTISANGGAGSGSQNGGGGGGRIAVYTHDLSGFNITNLTVTGGPGKYNGDDGTIYLGDLDTQPVYQPDLLISNPG